MPIPSDQRRHYGRHWREVVRPAMLARSELARLDVLPAVSTMAARGYVLGLTCERVEVCECDGRCGHAHPLGRCTEVNGAPAQGFAGEVRLGVAHLNQTPGDDRPENLLVLCQACHNRYDAPFRGPNAARSRRRAARASSPQLELVSIGQLALPIVHTAAYAACARAFDAHQPVELPSGAPRRRRCRRLVQVPMFTDRDP